MNTRASQTIGRKPPQKTAFVETIASVLPDSGLRRCTTFVGPEERYAMIAEAAYYRAEQRDFESGHELEDWYAAEQEIDAMLTRGEIPPASDVCDLD